MHRRKRVLIGGGMLLGLFASVIPSLWAQDFSTQCGETMTIATHKWNIDPEFGSNVIRAPAGDKKTKEECDELYANANYSDSCFKPSTCTYKNGWCLCSARGPGGTYDGWKCGNRACGLPSGATDPHRRCLDGCMCFENQCHLLQDGTGGEGSPAPGSTGGATTGGNEGVPVPQCGNGILESGEQCDGGICCANTCTFEESSTTCRLSNGPCDLLETCPGNSVDCPADTFKASTVKCRDQTDTCAATLCSGTNAACPDATCVRGMSPPLPSTPPPPPQPSSTPTPAPTPAPSPVCGNGKLEQGEECDDGNTTNGDGCAGSCKKERQLERKDYCCKRDGTVEEITTTEFSLLEKIKIALRAKDLQSCDLTKGEAVVLAQDKKNAEGRCEALHEAPERQEGAKGEEPCPIDTEGQPLTFLHRFLGFLVTQQPPQQPCARLGEICGTQDRLGNGPLRCTPNRNCGPGLLCHEQSCTCQQSCTKWDVHTLAWVPDPNLPCPTGLVCDTRSRTCQRRACGQWTDGDETEQARGERWKCLHTENPQCPEGLFCNHLTCSCQSEAPTEPKCGNGMVDEFVGLGPQSPNQIVPRLENCGEPPFEILDADRFCRRAYFGISGIRIFPDNARLSCHIGSRNGCYCRQNARCGDGYLDKGEQCENSTSFSCATFGRAGTCDNECACEPPPPPAPLPNAWYCVNAWAEGTREPTRRPTGNLCSREPICRNSVLRRDGDGWKVSCGNTAQPLPTRNFLPPAQENAYGAIVFGTSAQGYGTWRECSQACTAFRTVSRDGSVLLQPAIAAPDGQPQQDQLCCLPPPRDQPNCAGLGNNVAFNLKCWGWGSKLLTILGWETHCTNEQLGLSPPNQLQQNRCWNGLAGRPNQQAEIEQVHTCYQEKKNAADVQLRQQCLGWRFYILPACFHQRRLQNMGTVGMNTAQQYLNQLNQQCPQRQ